MEQGLRGGAGRGERRSPESMCMYWLEASADGHAQTVSSDRNGRVPDMTLPLSETAPFLVGRLAQCTGICICPALSSLLRGLAS